MGDTHPLANSERFVLMDSMDNPTDLNQEEHFRERKVSGSEGGFSLNGRWIIIIVATICFILSFTLFIATVVVYYGRPSLPIGETDCTKAAWEANANPIGGNPDDTRSNSVTEAKPKESESTTKSSGTSGSGWTEWSVTKFNGKNVKPGVLIYEEQFDTFNASSWEHLHQDPGTNFNHYVDSRNNSFARGGTLYLKPTFTADAYGENYVYNGTLFLGHLPSRVCVNNSNGFCWKKNGTEEIVHPIMTPMISSQPLFSFLYGRLEVRAKMPAGDWIEPLMTLQPSGSVYGSELQSGQIQMIDIRGNRALYNPEGVNIGSVQTCPDIRFGTLKTPRVVYDCQNTFPQLGFDTDFHLYQVEWTPDAITLSIDDSAIVTAPYPRKSMFDLYAKGSQVHNPWNQAANKKMAPFDREFHLVLGLNVGGINGFFADHYRSPYQKPWNNTEQMPAKSFWKNRHDWEPSWKGDAAALQIDYIRLYSLNTTQVSGASDNLFSEEEWEDHDEDGSDKSIGPAIPVANNVSHLTSSKNSSSSSFNTSQLVSDFENVLYDANIL